MRRIKIVTILSLLLLALIFTHSAQAGAWVQEKDTYYLRIYSSYLFASHEYNYLGNERILFEEHLGYRNSYFRNISLIIYAEYGLTNWLTMISEIPFTSLTLKRTIAGFYGGDEIATTSGLADLRLSGRVALFRVPVVVSLQGGALIPMGYSRQPANNGPRLGSGDISLEGHLLFGSSFYPLPMYFSGSAGYRYRHGALHDELIFTGEIGLTLGRFFFKTYVEVLRNVSVPPDIYGQQVITPLPGGGGVIPDVIIGDQHLTKIIPSVSYQLSKTLSVQAEVIQPLAGINTLSGMTYALGIVISN